jgi:hypothetical protein
MIESKSVGRLYLPSRQVEWIKDRLENLQEILENRTARSAKTPR